MARCTRRASGAHDHTSSTRRRGLARSVPETSKGKVCRASQGRIAARRARLRRIRRDIAVWRDSDACAPHRSCGLKAFPYLPQCCRSGIYLRTLRANVRQTDAVLQDFPNDRTGAYAITTSALVAGGKFTCASSRSSRSRHPANEQANTSQSSAQRSGGAAVNAATGKATSPLSGERPKEIHAVSWQPGNQPGNDCGASVLRCRAVGCALGWAGDRGCAGHHPLYQQGSRACHRALARGPHRTACVGGLS